MTPSFIFNETTTRKFPAEQQSNFLAPFTIDDRTYAEVLQANFPKIYRQAKKNLVREMTVLVVENLNENLRKFPAIIATGIQNDPSTWGYAFRYRADVPWYIVCVAGEYSHPEFNSYPVIKLLHTKDLIDWQSLDYFIANGLWSVQQNKSPTSDWQPINNFFFSLAPFIRPHLLNDLFKALSTVNFFSIEDELSLDLPFTMVMDKSHDAWMEVEALARTFYPPYCDPKVSEFWGQVRYSAKTQLWLARSRFKPEPEVSSRNNVTTLTDSKATVLGFLIAGLHPVNEEPHLHCVCVLPDERRRGIATSLVRRFFSQTGHASAAAGIHMGPKHWQYEAAGFLKSLGASLQIKGKTIWRWQVPSPMRVMCEEAK